jgi:UDPglucose 6-dehydrogenase
MSIGIIGNGVVGATLAKYTAAHKPKIYDLCPERSFASVDDVLQCDLVFFCTLLLSNACSAEERHLLSDYVEQTKPTATIVIKSTVVPGTCDWLQDKFPSRTILCSPEFLTEKASWDDFIHPKLQVVGGREEAARSLLLLLPEAPHTFITTLRKAEWVKSTIAGYLSTKVSWFDQLYESLGDDFWDVRQIVTSDPRIGNSHSDPLQDGYRGWGGKCFTKDTPIFAEAAKHSLTQLAVDYNRQLIARKTK